MFRFYTDQLSRWLCLLHRQNKWSATSSWFLPTNNNKKNGKCHYSTKEIISFFLQPRISDMDFYFLFTQFDFGWISQNHVSNINLKYEKNFCDPYAWWVWMWITKILTKYSTKLCFNSFQNDIDLCTFLMKIPNLTATFYR